MSGRNGKAITPFVPRTDDLLEAYRRSGAAADFEQIVGRFAALVFTECRRVTKDPHDAEDAAQLTFLALAIELKSGTTIRQPGAWLSRVAKRQAMKIVRSRGRRQRREAFAGRDEAAPVDPITPAQAAADQAVVAGIVREAIDALPEHYRLPLVLHYFGGLKLESIAHELGVSKQAVGTRLHRARKMIAQFLSDRGINYDAGTLAGLIALVVPAGVVTAMVRSISATSLVPGSATSTATGMAIGHSVSAMLRASGIAALSRPLLTICATVSLSAAGGFAYVGPADVVRVARVVRERIDFGQWFDWLTQSTTSPGQYLPSVPSLPSMIDPPSLRISSDWQPPTTQTQTWPAIPHVPSAADVALPPPRHAAPTLAEVAAALDARRHTLARANPFPTPTLHASPATIDRDEAAPHIGSSPAGEAAGSDERTPSEITIAPSGGSPSVGGGGFGTAPPYSTGDGTIGGDGIPVPFVPQLDVGSPDGQTIHILPDASFHGGHVRIGVEAGDAGTIVQDGGTATIDDLAVGVRGNGVFELRNGAQLSVNHFVIGADHGSIGAAYVYGGAAINFYVTNVGGGFEIGNAGDGRLILGSASGPGNVTFFTDATSGGTAVVVRGTDSGRGLIAGWGGVFSSGAFEMNDRVIADGYGFLRTLDLTSFGTIVNTIDNPVGGDAGWYVRRGGRIALPRFDVKPGTHTYTWGESSDDTTLDLVNSLRFVANGQPTKTTLDVSLRTIATADPIDVPLPAGVAIFALWEFDAAGRFDPTGLDVTARYDDRLATLYAAEDDLKLMAYVDGHWTWAGAAWRDDLTKLIGGHFVGAFDYLAVAADLAARPIQPLPVSVSTPEPTMLVTLFSVLSFGLTRRRRPV